MGPDGLTVTGPPALHGITADLADCSEISMVLGALAALAGSPSVLTGIGHQRHQETDRLAALATEIYALAATSPSPTTAWRSGPGRCGPAAPSPPTTITGW